MKKNNFRFLLSALFAFVLSMTLVPQNAMAGSYYHKQTIKVAYYDAAGNYQGDGAFTSKNFSGTITSTYAGTYAWTWSANGKEYLADGTFQYSGNASVNMLHPSDLWNYDSDKYTFAGGNKSLCAPDKVSYKASNWKTSCSGHSNTMNGVVTSNSEYFYYIFQEKAPEVTYTLNYNTKGGTPTINAQTITNNTGSATFTISSTVPSKEGFNFLGWSATDGGAVAYNPGGSLTTSNESTTIYAVWEKIALPGNLTISCSGLQNGESAVIEVKNLDSQRIYLVSVNSENTSVTIKGISAGEYRVLPLGWSWTYESIATQQVTIQEEQTATVSFTAVKKSANPKNAEDSKSQKKK